LRFTAVSDAAAEVFPGEEALLGDEDARAVGFLGPAISPANALCGKGSKGSKSIRGPSGAVKVFFVKGDDLLLQPRGVFCRQPGLLQLQLRLLFQVQQPR
jgi:hypothetical protein